MMNDDLFAAVNSLYETYRSWPQTGQIIADMAHKRGVICDVTDRDVNRFMALANKVYHEKVGDSPTLCQALGLPPLRVPVPPCSSCGKVHVTPWCVEEQGEPVPAPRPRPQRQRREKRHRLALEVDTEEELAALRAAFDAHGSRRDVGRALAAGRLALVETGDE